MNDAAASDVSTSVESEDCDSVRSSHAVIRGIDILPDLDLEVIKVDDSSDDNDDSSNIDSEHSCDDHDDDHDDVGSNNDDDSSDNDDDSSNHYDIDSRNEDDDEAALCQPPKRDDFFFLSDEDYEQLSPGDMTILLDIFQAAKFNEDDMERLLSDFSPVFIEDGSVSILLLRYCSNLSFLPTHFGNLASLKTLLLSHCYELVELPSTFGDLSSLEELDLHNCLKLKQLPAEFGNLSMLRSLFLGEFYRLTKLPPTFGDLISLEKLNLHNFPKLKQLPSNFGNLIVLKSLSLNECSILVELPQSFGNLLNLEELSLSACTKLKHLPEDLGDMIMLKRLNLDKCFELTELPESFASLANLEELDLQNCLKLMYLPSDFGNLIKLESLNLYECPELRELPSTFSMLPNLTKLDVHSCSRLRQLPSDFGNLRVLYSLNLHKCDEVTELPMAFGDLRNLEKLHIQSCSSLTYLPVSVGSLQRLRVLNLYKCSELRELPSTIGKLVRLEQLNLTGCNKLEELPPELGNLDRLEIAGLGSCRRLKLPPPDEVSTSARFVAYMKTLLTIRDEPLVAVEKPECTDRQLLLLLCNCPTYAESLRTMLWKNQELRMIKNDEGLTIIDLACGDLLEAMLFHKRYELEMEPKYESAASKVYFAIDKKREDGRLLPVALKFMFKEEDYRAEVRAQTEEDGSKRFEEKYVLSMIDQYDDSDLAFNAAAVAWNLPPFCLVMERGDRTLLEAMMCENFVRNDMKRVRSILLQLAACLAHVHARGVVHGDFTPKSAVRCEGNRQWKLTDFGASFLLSNDASDDPDEEGKGCYKDGKVSTAYMPPEIVTIAGGRPSVRSVCTVDDCSRQSDTLPEGVQTTNEDSGGVCHEHGALVASAKVDVWSFGVVMFWMIVGEPLFMSTSPIDGSLSERDLLNLSSWRDGSHIGRLRNVRDPDAKRLLRMLLSRNPDDRLSMDDVMKDDFFLPIADLIARLADFTSQLEEARSKSDGISVRILLEKIKSSELLLQTEERYSDVEILESVDADEEEPNALEVRNERKAKLFARKYSFTTVSAVCVLMGVGCILLSSRVKKSARLRGWSNR